MKKYIVGDNYEDLKEFDTLEEAKEFMNRYIEDSIPEMERIYGACGVTRVFIKELDCETFKNAHNVICYRIKKESVIESVAI